MSLELRIEEFSVLCFMKCMSRRLGSEVGVGCTCTKSVSEKPYLGANSIS